MARGRGEVISDIGVLYPPFAHKIKTLIACAKEEGLSISVYETYRSPERQKHLFIKGVTTLQQNSMHQYGVAADLMFENTRSVVDMPEQNWRQLGALGRTLGLYWGGDWEDFKDYPHFQLIPATKHEQQKILEGEYPTY